MAAVGLRALVGDGLILDLGCGPGHLFGAIGPPVIGLDASSGMLTLARDRDVVPVVMGDLEVLPFASEAAAAVLGNFSFQHLPKPGFDRAVVEAARVLKPLGVIQLAMHAGDFEGDDRPGDDLPGRWFTYWEEHQLAAHLASASLDIQEMHHEGQSLRITATKAASRRTQQAAHVPL